LWLTVAAWDSVPLTKIAQAKARIRKVLLAELNVELMTQIYSGANVSMTFIGRASLD
jgi:hypothetical protein